MYLPTRSAWEIYKIKKINRSGGKDLSLVFPEKFVIEYSDKVIYKHE
jgi:hypothetical protein